MKKYLNFLSENFHFLMVKFSVYLNRRVFVMFQTLVCQIRVHKCYTKSRTCMYVMFSFKFTMTSILDILSKAYVLQERYSDKYV